LLGKKNRDGGARRKKRVNLHIWGGKAIRPERKGNEERGDDSRIS